MKLLNISEEKIALLKSIIKFYALFLDTGIVASSIMNKEFKVYPQKTDLDKCEDEPIHLIPNVQTHGFMLVLDDDKIIQTSDNVERYTGRSADQILGTDITSFFDTAALSAYKKWSMDKIDHIPFKTVLQEVHFYCIPHQSESGIILEFEPELENWNSMDYHREMLGIFKKLSATKELSDLLKLAVRELKELLHYDRVMIYKFDKSWNGLVAAEAKNDDMQSWEGLQYPASDIPKMAREMFLKQGTRIISDVQEQYSCITPGVNPKTGVLTNVGKTHLRGSSPIHIEYLKNMGVGASMTAAIVIDNTLWGLIACHHNTAKYVDYIQRESTQLLSEMIANQIVQKETKVYLDNLQSVSKIRENLIDHLSENWDIISGLTAKKSTAQNLIDSCGFCIIHNEEVVTIGVTPAKEKIIEIIDNLKDDDKLTDDFFETNCLKEHCEWDEHDSKLVSGILIHRISEKFDTLLIWFRPEVISTVTWGGNPDKKTDATKEERLTPRKSFEKWKQQVFCTSTPWEDYEISAAKDLATAIKNVMVTKFGEISYLNKKLKNLNQELKNFSYTVSHDLRGPLRGIDGFAQILLEDYSDVLDDEGVQYLKFILSSAEKMNDLMDNILSYSGLNEIKVKPQEINTNELCQEIINDAFLAVDYKNTSIKIQENLPTIFADRSMMYQLFYNLLSNAFKYSSTQNNPKVEVSSKVVDKKNVFQIKDNGIGLNTKYSNKIFGIFTRLVTNEFKGTGLGLAIALRIILKHDGDIWVESNPNEGAVFSFYILDKTIS